jgi:hypothetical protein
MVAAEKGSVHMVDFLVNAGADVNVATNVSELTKRSDVDASCRHIIVCVAQCSSQLLPSLLRLKLTFGGDSSQ